MSVVASAEPGRRRQRAQGDQRHRHDAAAGRLPALVERAQPRAQVVDGRLRRVAARPGDVHRGHRAEQLPRSGYAKDCSEVEGYVRGFARRRPDVAITVLRCADILGADIDSQLGQYLRLPVVPTVLGFDPRLQLLHPDDALEVVHPGGGQRPARHLQRRRRRRADAVAAAAQARPRDDPGAGRRRSALSARRCGAPRGWTSPPDQVALLTYGRVVDTTRRCASASATSRAGRRRRRSTTSAARSAAGRVDADRVRQVERRLVALRRGADQGAEVGPWVRPRSSRSASAVAPDAAAARRRRARRPDRWRRPAAGPVVARPLREAPSAELPVDEGANGARPSEADDGLDAGDEGAYERQEAGARADDVADRLDVQQADAAAAADPVARRSRSCAAASPVTTRSTSSASTPS